MGADHLRLFDKKLCDEVVALDRRGLETFVAEHQRKFPEFSVFRFASDLSSSQTIRELIDGGESEASMKELLVLELCMSCEILYVDYWGCYVEAFAAKHPPGAVGAKELFPAMVEEPYLLLLPEHLDTILHSLEGHRDELTIMKPDDIVRLRQWRDACSKDCGLRVAYWLG